MKNTKTVLITGCSSGYGLETARHFHAQGWNVVATMRTPREDLLPRSDRLHVVALAVTKAATLETGMEIRVPLFIKEGERVKVHTETREFAGRA